VGRVFEAVNSGIFKMEGSERKSCDKVWRNKSDG
jgi:hypothetical protein